MSFWLLVLQLVFCGILLYFGKKKIELFVNFCLGGRFIILKSTYLATSNFNHGFFFKSTSDTLSIAWLPPFGCKEKARVWNTILLHPSYQCQDYNMTERKEKRRRGEAGKQENSYLGSLQLA